MANNPYVNKVEYAGETVMDISNDTATPSDVLDGVTFHDRSGAPQTGSLITHNVYDGLDSTSTTDALSAKQGKVLNDKRIYTQKSGRSTYLTSYNISYVHCGNICVFSGTFVPNTNISNSTGAIDNCGLPKPLDGINVFPVSKNNSSFVASDISGRSIGIYNAGDSTTSATFKAVGAYTSGESYSFSGAYVTRNVN